jgi:carbon monoxide dehydrogenase subunit G
MARYVTTAKTDWDPETAFDYLAEFSNVADWDPGVSRGRSVSADPLEVGAQFEVEASFLGRSVPLTSETVEIERPRRVTVRADSGTFSSVDTLTFEPEPSGGTLVTYDADLRLKSALKLLDPLLAIGFNRIADKARDGLRERLAGDPPAAT